MKFDNLLRISKMKKVRGLPRLKKPNNVKCKQCQLEKMRKYSFKRKTYTYDVILGLVHIDLCGSIRVQIKDNEKYFIIFFDDYSIVMIVRFLKEKSDEF